MGTAALAISIPFESALTSGISVNKLGSDVPSLFASSAIYKSSETGYRLPRGRFKENSVPRGYGWKYIDQTTEITKSELKTVLNLGEGSKTVEVTKFKVSEKVTYLVGARGGPDQTEVWIIRIVGAEAVRAASEQINRRVDTEKLIENVGSYATSVGTGAVRKFNRGRPEARIAALAGPEAAQTYRNLAIADKEAFGETLVEAGREGWLTGDDIETVLEAVDEGRLRGTQVVEASDRIDALSNPAIARKTVGKKPVLGFEFIDELDGSSDAKAFFGQADSAQQVADFLDAVDTDAKEVIDEASSGAYGDILDLSSPEQEVMVEVVVEEELNGEDKLASDDITPREIEELSGDTDLERVQMVAKTGNGNIRYLEPEGMTHIRKRHIDGTQTSPSADNTTFFPLGQSVTRGGDTRPMPDAQITETDIQGYIRKSLENGGGDSDFRLDQRGIRYIRVGIKENGNVSTAYPVNGTNVRQWNTSEKEWRYWNANKGSWEVWNLNPNIPPKLWKTMK